MDRDIDRGHDGDRHDRGHSDNDRDNGGFDNFRDFYDRDISVGKDREREIPLSLMERSTGGQKNIFHERISDNELSNFFSNENNAKIFSKDNHDNYNQNELDFKLIKQTFREANANLGERCTEWMGSDSSLPSHDSMLSNLGEKVGAAIDEIGALADFGSNFLKMQINSFAKSDKYYHCMANCEAASRGAGGENAARTLSCFREASDVVINTLFKGKVLDYTLKDSPLDMSANRTGLDAGRSGVRCSYGCQRYEKNWPEPKYR